MTFCTRQKLCVLLMTLLCTSSVLLYLSFNFSTKETILRDKVDVLPTWKARDKVQVKKILGYPIPNEVKSIKKRVLKLDNCTRVWQHKITDSVLKVLDITFYSNSKIEGALVNTSKEDQKKLKPFLPLQDTDSKRALVRAYMVMKEALDRVNVDNIVVEGTLLGLHRFSTILPWDDDMDIWISFKHWPKVWEALSCVEGHELMVDSSLRWSFFPSNGKHSAMPPKKYPFIDIFFYTNDTEYIWTWNKVARPATVSRTEYMFPLRYGILEGIKVLVPRVPEYILKDRFGSLDKCKTQPLAHFRHFRGHFSVACSKLFPLYGRFPVQKFI